MEFLDLIEQVVEVLQRQGRISYRALKRRNGLRERHTASGVVARAARIGDLRAEPN